MGVTNFCTKLPKGTPLPKSGRTNRLAYVAVTCFDTRERREKKVRENRHWKLDVVYNTTAATAPS